ncbi:hypothetical protein F5Y13DRAFT_181396 [Hypoxylon sp. FL1857]|nr:hypothetical protein F5Y13DRAFT_181396 [Hypoxylon sp. FL1857]
MDTDMETLDFLIVGAGISGINSAYRIQTEIPEASYAILENRDTLGGTWDVWKYPGVRCDSDISTLAFPWHSWAFPRGVVEGPLILEYLKDAASKHGIDRRIQFRHKVISANWSSTRHRWDISVDNYGQQKQFAARFLVLGTGFFNYDKPFEAEIPGLDRFKGRVINPQLWPSDYDYTNQKVVVIGSGATAVGLVPALPEKAAQVTMVQRSPSHIALWDNGLIWGYKYFPLSFVNGCRRLWCAVRLYLFVLFCETYPQAANDALRKTIETQLPSWVPYNPHFQPRYNPWDQRMSVDPDAAFYKSLHLPNVKLITGEIDTITENGLNIQGGENVQADAIVAATGFRMQLGGNIRIRVDNEDLVWKERFIWNGAVLNGVPNMLFSIGYPKNSWTLGADDTAFILVRLFKYMKNKGFRAAVPRVPGGRAMQKSRLWYFSATFVKLADTVLPVYGDTGPWRPRRNPVADWLHARWGNITTGLGFSR